MDWLAGVALVAVVEHALERGRRQVRRVRVHVAQEQEEGLVLSGQPVQLRQRDVVEVLRLGAAALVPAPPAGVVQIGVEAARGRVAGEADAGSVVARRAQGLGQRGDFGAQRPLVAQGDHLRGKDVHAGQHGAVGAGRRDVRAVSVFEQRPARREAVQVRHRQARVAVTAQVVGAQ